MKSSACVRIFEFYSHTLAFCCSVGLGVGINTCVLSVQYHKFCHFLPLGYDLIPVSACSTTTILSIYLFSLCLCSLVRESPLWMSRSTGLMALWWCTTSVTAPLSSQLQLLCIWSESSTWELPKGTVQVYQSKRRPGGWSYFLSSIHKYLMCLCSVGRRSLTRNPAQGFIIEQSREAVAAGGGWVGALL